MYTIYMQNENVFVRLLNFYQSQKVHDYNSELQSNTLQNKRLFFFFNRIGIFIVPNLWNT